MLNGKLPEKEARLIHGCGQKNRGQRTGWQLEFSMTGGINSSSLIKRKIL